MPVFAAYGLLTAVMIAFSLLASLTVLPSLLYILTPGEKVSDAVPVSASR
jgi:predicted RND superfamily exporter protein